MNRTTRLAVRMGAMEGIYWCAVAAIASYATAMFLSEGVKPGLIGVVALVSASVWLPSKSTWVSVSPRKLPVTV